MSVTVLIPVVQETSSALSTCLSALRAHAPNSLDLYVVDGSRSGDRSQHDDPDLHYLRPDEPLDFLALCRWAYKTVWKPESDLWIIDPSVVIGPGTLEALAAVFRLYERHAIAVPRSNRPGISAIPLTGPELPADLAYNVWETLCSRLPQYQIIPSADAFCMLIRKEVLGHFGFIRADEDEHAYSARINRYGYSTVLANRAFVRSFASSEHCEDLTQYLDFDADPVDYFGSLAAPHRPRILYDLFHLAPRHYGTSDFALNLLRALQPLAKDDFDIFIDIQPASLEFFLPELQGYSFYRAEVQPPQKFDLVFKPTQINSWEELERINRLAPRVAYTILDMIAVRCSYLSSPGKGLLFRKLAELCDQTFAISNSVRSDFACLTGSTTSLEAIHLGTNYGISASEYITGSYVLLMGNSYTHKGLNEALRVLETGDLPVVVLGASAPTANAIPQVRYLESGSLSRETVRETLANARVLVYPSHYEGFGLPVVDALALGKPVLVLENEMNRELATLTGSYNVYRIPSLDNLNEAVKRAWNHSPQDDPQLPRRWQAAAEEYLARFRELLGRDVDDTRLRARWDFLRARRA